MKLLLTGSCGFVGRTLAEGLLDFTPPGQLSIIGLDNLSRPGSATNWEPLRRRGVHLVHGDIRAASDVESVGPVDWIIDCAESTGALAGVNGHSSSRQVVEHNLSGTVNLLEHCKTHRAGFTLLSTSRVYSISPLSSLHMMSAADLRELAPALCVTGPDECPISAAPCPPNSEHCPLAAAVCPAPPYPPGLSPGGISESFSTTPPVSLYGVSKLASENLALEYGAAFGFPVWVNRCSLMAGAGQFGRQDQNIFAYWLNAWLRNRSLEYIGFGGNGAQVRDCLHPRDLVPALLRQMDKADMAVRKSRPRVYNFGGGVPNSISLAQLSAWCEDRWGKRDVKANATARPFDVPWLVLDSTLAATQWNWKASTPLSTILEQVAKHAEANPNWLELSGAA